MRMEHTLSKGLDKNILVAINKITGEWIPATKNGKAISSKILLILDVGSETMNNEKDLPYLWHSVLAYTSITRRIIPINKRIISH